MRENASGFMDLTNCAWMVRELGEPVSCVHLLDDASILVGGWDGCIKYWSDEGDLIWSTVASNRVSAMVRDQDHVYATSGLDVVCLSLLDGQEQWSIALEGSADSLVATEACLFATSSVYDIEHNDFIESAIWVISFQGEVLKTHRMAERPWTLSTYDNGVITGIGRPLNGYIIFDENGDIVDRENDWDSPTICATGQNNPVFGLADGSLRTPDGTILKKMSSAITDVDQFDESYIVAEENGRVEWFDENRNWTSNGSKVVALSHGFTIHDYRTIWIARWNGSQGELNVRSADAGEFVASLPNKRIHSIASSNARMAVGCENGQVYVWDKVLFERRISQPVENQSDVSRNEMLKRLRALRK